MAQNKRKHDSAAGRPTSGQSSLFTEWPAPSEVVEGFGGNPEKAEKKQWKPGGDQAK